MILTKIKQNCKNKINYLKFKVQYLKLKILLQKNKNKINLKTTINLRFQKVNKYKKLLLKRKQKKKRI